MCFLGLLSTLTLSGCGSSSSSSTSDKQKVIDYIGTIEVSVATKTKLSYKASDDLFSIYYVNGDRMYFATCAFGSNTLSCKLNIITISYVYEAHFTTYVSNHLYSGIGSFEEISGPSLGTTGTNAAEVGIKNAIKNVTSYLELHKLPYIY